MIGFVQFFLEDRDYGFIRYASTEGSDRLDLSIVFHASNAVDRTKLSRGQRVSFEIGAWDDGKPTALDVRPADTERFTGFVATFNPQRQFGFVADRWDPYSQHGRYFFNVVEVEPDVIGQRAISEGARVSFVLGIRNGRQEAVAVRNEDPTLSEIDPSTYVEQGQVHDFNGDVGHVVRPCGDHLVFLVKNVVSEGVETIQPGTWLQYSIVVERNRFHEQKLRFWNRVYATNIFVCLPNEEPEARYEPGSAEEFFARAPELPVSMPEPPAPEPMVEERVYSDQERHMTLRELIARKKCA